MKGSHGIGHTRWATVGSPTTENAHPHLDCSGSIAIVHNGEIENYAVLRERLINQGHTFRSETDSEVLAHLVESHRGQGEVGAVAAALREVEGTYALATLQRDSARLVMARRESPLVVGLGDGESFVASDVPALLENTREMVFLEDGDLALLSPGGLQVWNDGVRAARRVHHITWDTRDLDRAGYEHFFLKEVHEQPRVIRDTLSGRVSSTEPGVTLDVDLSSQPRPESILLSGCGTAYHACLIGRAVLPGAVSRPRAGQGGVGAGDAGGFGRAFVGGPPQSVRRDGGHHRRGKERDAVRLLHDGHHRGRGQQHHEDCGRGPVHADGAGESAWRRPRPSSHSWWTSTCWACTSIRCLRRSSTVC